VPVSAQDDQHPDAARGTRERIVLSASRLLQQQGYDGTGIKQIAREAGASLGSVYHFFPGGKQELGTEAIARMGHEFATSLGATLRSEEDAGAAVAACARLLAGNLRDAERIDDCGFVSTALGIVGRAPEVREAIARAVQSWQDLVAEKLRGAGISADDAQDLASTVLATLEGAETASRISGSDAPLHVAAVHLAKLISTYRDERASE
jgi:AcrR family transcriptional regulator